MVRWEYAAVTRSLISKRIRKTSPEYKQLTEKVRRDWAHNKWTSYNWYEEVVWIRLPGREPEKRVMWDPSLGAYTEVSLFSVLNELGAEGWELVSDSTPAHLVAEYFGHERAGRPIEQRLFLKRPCD